MMWTVTIVSSVKHVNLERAVSSLEK